MLRVLGCAFVEFTHLGRSGLSVSRMCLGTMNFGPETEEADSFSIMDRAHEVGINFIDTADVYGWKEGAGITEGIIGRWFAQGGERRDRTVLATKVFGSMGSWPNEGRLSALHIRRACDASLRRLQTDYIDLYQIVALQPLCQRHRAGGHSCRRRLWAGRDRLVPAPGGVAGRDPAQGPRRQSSSSGA